MKRDMDLVRQIMLAIESDDGTKQIRLKIDGHSDEEIDYHLGLLDGAGLIDAIDTKVLNGCRYIPQRLTWEGHEFLDAAKNDTVWKKVKDKLGPAIGAVGLDIVKELLTDATKEMLGIG